MADPYRRYAASSADRGYEMPPEETIDGIPVVEIPSSPEEEKPKRDLLLLEFSAKDLENWNDGDLDARYIQQVQNLSEVTEKLYRAQDRLSRTKTHIELITFKKEEITALLLMLTEELSEDEERIKILREERDQCKEVHFDVAAGLEKLDAEKKEARVALEAINVQYEAAKEKFEWMSNYLVQLVRRPPSNQAAEPSTTSFYTAELATATSTVVDPQQQAHD